MVCAQDLLEAGSGGVPAPYLHLRWNAPADAGAGVEGTHMGGNATFLTEYAFEISQAADFSGVVQARAPRFTRILGDI